jgi:hypothetical protein
MTEALANELHRRRPSRPNGYTYPTAFRLPVTITRLQSLIGASEVTEPDWPCSAAGSESLPGPSRHGVALPRSRGAGQIPGAEAGAYDWYSGARNPQARRACDRACQPRACALCSSPGKEQSRVDASSDVTPRPVHAIGVLSGVRSTQREGRGIKSRNVMVFIKCLDYCFPRTSPILSLTTGCLPVGEASSRLSPQSV